MSRPDKISSETFERIRRLFPDNPNSEIAKRCGVAVSTIYNYAEYYDWKKSTAYIQGVRSSLGKKGGQSSSLAKKISFEIFVRLRFLYPTCPNIELAQLCGVTASTICKYAKFYKWRKTDKYLSNIKLSDRRSCISFSCLDGKRGPNA